MRKKTINRNSIKKYYYKIYLKKIFARKKSHNIKSKMRCCAIFIRFFFKEKRPSYVGKMASILKSQ